jgi:hypothetical protein
MQKRQIISDFGPMFVNRKKKFGTLGKKSRLTMVEKSSENPEA